MDGFAESEPTLSYVSGRPSLAGILDPSLAEEGLRGRG